MTMGVIALAAGGVVVFGLAIAFRSWRSWVIGYCAIALAVTIYGCTQHQAQRSYTQTAEVR